MLQPIDPLWSTLSKVTKKGPLVATNFLSFSSNSNKNQNIFLKFSALVHHKSVQIFWKKLGCNSNSLPATAHFGQILNLICWDISKRKKLMRFETYIITLMEGIFNIFKKMAFWNFLASQGVHLQNVHDLALQSIGRFCTIVMLKTLQLSWCHNVLPSLWGNSWIL